jgi:hypothetical protein
MVAGSSGTNGEGAGFSAAVAELATERCPRTAADAYAAVVIRLVLGRDILENAFGQVTAAHVLVNENEALFREQVGGTQGALVVIDPVRRYGVRVRFIIMGYFCDSSLGTYTAVKRQMPSRIRTLNSYFV